MADDVTGNMLVLNGLPVLVLDGTWVQRPHLYTGARVRVKDGSLRSTEGGGTVFPFLGSKRVYDCQVDVYDQAEETALRAACPRGQSIPVSGYLLPEQLDMAVDLGDIATVTADFDGVLTILRTASLHLEEV